MKKSLLYSGIVSVFLLTSVKYSDAKVWRVNNNPGITADFTTPQAAHNGAMPGDTLHIEPSPDSYGNLVLSKRLTIISIGDFLKHNQNPGLQYHEPNTGFMDDLTITNAAAAGSVLHCNFTGSATVTGVNNLRFERCHVGGDFILSNANNNVITQCFILLISLRNASSNNLITNNILNKYLEVQSTSSATISNNIVNITYTSNNNYDVDIYNSTFQNNIIYVDQQYDFRNSNVKNSITSRAVGSSALPVGNDNQNGVNMDDVFPPLTTARTIDKDFMLKNGSLAAGTGVNHEDIGAFGGPTPYKLALQPAIPAIYKLTAPATTVGNTLNIVFSTRSNN